LNNSERPALPAAGGLTEPEDSIAAIPETGSGGEKSPGHHEASCDEGGCEKLFVILTERLNELATLHQGATLLEEERFSLHKVMKELIDAKDNLELQVSRRTEELKKSNEALQAEIQERVQAEGIIRKYQAELRQLGLELSLAEERERRAIASDLHDHIGQALAMIKMRLHKLQGNAIFCGYDKDIDEMQDLLNKTISYTRSLTFELSPPLLYELGLNAALGWLAEETGKKNGLLIKVQEAGERQNLTNEIKVVLFKAVRELLINVVKHAQAREIAVHIMGEPEGITVVVQDDGVGFEPSLPELRSTEQGGFGLFSIKERLDCLGGSLSIASQRGQGTEVSLFLPAQPGDRKVDEDGYKGSSR
jgi:signal transduction histidine kinase